MCTQQIERKLFILTLLLTMSLWTRTSISAEEKPVAPEAAHASQPTQDSVSSKSKIAPQNNPQAETRNFYQVLEDVFSDFEFDLKNNDVKGLQNISIKNVVVSENIPPSFATHLEHLTSEKILKYSRSTLIQCQRCRSKSAKLSNDNVVISAPESNPLELSRIARANGINNFMDVAFAYQPTGMILSFYITDSENGSVVWSRSYNSETSRASAFRRGVDYSQMEEARQEKEYVPTVQYRTTIYYLFERVIGKYAGHMAIGFRASERYDNRKKEVGFEVNYFKPISSLASDEKEAEKNPYSGMNLTLLFVHSWNLIRFEENYNDIRGNIFVGIGGTYASGFLGGLIRGGYEWRLAKHWAATAMMGLRPPSSVFVNNEKVGTISGVEFGLGVSLLF